MTTPAFQAEADRVEIVYYWALNQLGNAMAVDSLELWKSVPASSEAAKSASWLHDIIRLLFGFRTEAQKLAIAYYRLTRALRTGYAPATGDEQDGETVSLEQLRVDFEKIVDHIDIETAGDIAPNWGEDGNATFDDQPTLQPLEDDAEIKLEHVADIDKLIAEADDAALQEAGDYLDALGIQNLVDKLDQVNADSPSRDADIAQAHSDAGNRQAAAAMRIMMNAARGLVYDLAATDLRIIGWVRYSRTGTPCGWCAMLISRGVVYKTRASASAKTNKDGNRIVGPDAQVADQNKYHDNCRCVAVPIFLQAQYDNSPLFALNREYSLLWPKVTKGLSGKSALSEWRRYFRQLQAPAQAAA